jgi:predicted transcriptional regulator YdeE
VAGLVVRTTNAVESTPQRRIAPLWARFRSEGWFDRLEKVGALGPPIGVYSSYESDASGSYQLLAGREIRASRPLPEPLHFVSVPQGSYLVFTSSGPMPQAVIDGWGNVLAFFARADSPRRAYAVDFEIYPDGESVEIWVGVKE